MTGDLSYYRPGEEPPATLVAGTGGAYPSRGDAVEIVGQNRDGPEVGALTAAPNLVGTLVDLPPNFDETQDVAEGDVLGHVTIRVTHYVEWFHDADGSATAGDLVVVDADGARAYDEVGGDTADMAVGPCWRTTQTDEGTTDKVAVVRSRL